MNMFSNLVVLREPTTENKDWSFIFGDLQIEVRESMVELTDKIVSFEKYSNAVESLNVLLDYIDRNNGKLEKVVFDFVNQNNELASALGIVMPYSFATEEEQAQAAQDVQNAANGDKENDERSFFARAWETIKKFFGKIRDAIVNVWNKLRGKSDEGLAQQAAENAQVASGMPDSEFAKFQFTGIASPAILSGIVKACQDMSSNVAALPTEPGAFFKEICSKYSSAFEALGIGQHLAQLGIEAVKGNDGKYNIAKRDNKYNGTSEQATEKWDKTLVVKSKEWTVQFIEMKRKLNEQAEAFSKMLDSLQADKAKLDQLAKDMASESYEKRPYLKKKSWWHFFYNEQVDLKNADIRNQNKQYDDLQKRKSANKSEQAKVSASMSFGQEVAALNQFILKLISLFETEVTGIVGGIHKIVVERKAAANDREQESLKARAKLGDQYQEQINKTDTRTDEEKDSDSAANDYSNERDPDEF